MWQHVQMPAQIVSWDTLACCWGAKQPTNDKQQSPSAFLDLHLYRLNTIMTLSLFFFLFFSLFVCCLFFGVFLFRFVLLFWLVAYMQRCVVVWLRGCLFDCCLVARLHAPSPPPTPFPLPPLRCSPKPSSE